MRHRCRGRQLSVDSEHRRAMRRNLVASLFIHEGIKTTLPKAKEVRPMAEKLITLARRAKAFSDQGTPQGRAESVFLRRRAASLLGWQRTTLKIRARRKRFGDEPLTAHDGVIRKLFNEIGPRFADRNGGYTRILKLSQWRIGDAGMIARLELMPREPERKGATVSPRKRARHRRGEGFEAARRKRQQRRLDEAARKASREQTKAQVTVAEQMAAAATTATSTTTASGPATSATVATPSLAEQMTATASSTTPAETATGQAPTPTDQAPTPTDQAPTGQTPPSETLASDAPKPSV